MPSVLFIDRGGVLASVNQRSVQSPTTAAQQTSSVGDLQGELLKVFVEKVAALCGSPLFNEAVCAKIGWRNVRWENDDENGSMKT